jgi:hypothetical protein
MLNNSCSQFSSVPFVDEFLVAMEDRNNIFYFMNLRLSREFREPERKKIENTGLEVDEAIPGNIRITITS